MEVPKCLCAEFKHTGKHLGGCPYYPRPDAKIRYEKAMTDSTKKCCAFCSEETLHDPTGWQGGCTDKGCKCHSSPDGGAKDLTARIEEIMRKHYENEYNTTAAFPRAATEIAALLEEEVAHDTLDGYCCACDYDQAEFEHKLAKFKTRILERLPEPAEIIESDYENGRADALEEVRKIITDI